MFNVISNRLLFPSPSPSPSLRSALYRVIAPLPGVQLLGSRTDRVGRRGDAVTISHVEVGDEGTRTVFIQRGVVNSIHDLPGGRQLPFANSLPGIGGGR